MLYSVFWYYHSGTQIAKMGPRCWKNAHSILFTLTELNLNLDTDRGFGSSQLRSYLFRSFVLTGHSRLTAAVSSDILAALAVSRTASIVFTCVLTTLKLQLVSAHSFLHQNHCRCERKHKSKGFHWQLAMDFRWCEFVFSVLDPEWFLHPTTDWSQKKIAFSDWLKREFDCGWRENKPGVDVPGSLQYWHTEWLVCVTNGSSCLGWMAWLQIHTPLRWRNMKGKPMLADPWLEGGWLHRPLFAALAQHMRPALHVVRSLHSWIGFVSTRDGSGQLPVITFTLISVTEKIQYFPLNSKLLLSGNLKNCRFPSGQEKTFWSFFELCLFLKQPVLKWTGRLHRECSLYIVLKKRPERIDLTQCFGTRHFTSAKPFFLRQQQMQPKALGDPLWATNLLAGTFRGCSRSLQSCSTSPPQDTARRTYTRWPCCTHWTWHRLCWDKNPGAPRWK